MESNLLRQQRRDGLVLQQRHAKLLSCRRDEPIMRRPLVILAAAATIAAVATPAAADGVRRPWRGSAYAIGAISRNVITPYYVGYYGGHYSYFAPDPVYPVYPRQCWFWGYGYPYRVC